MIALIKPNTYEQNNKTIHVHYNKKHAIKGKPIQRIKDLEGAEEQFSWKPPLPIWQGIKLEPITQMSGSDSNCSKGGKKGHYANHASVLKQNYQKPGSETTYRRKKANN